MFPDFPIPLLPSDMFGFSRCCDLCDSSYIPKFWGSYSFGSCWDAPDSITLFRPRDHDDDRPSIRIVIDNFLYSARGKAFSTAFRS